MAARALQSHDKPERRGTLSPSPSKPARNAGSTDAPPLTRRWSSPCPATPSRSSHKNSRRNPPTPARPDRRSGTPGLRHPVAGKFIPRKLVVGEVAILKGGDVMDDATVAAEGDGYLALCSTDRFGPDPEILPKQMRLVDRKLPACDELGSVVSPSPSSLPFPASFFEQKDGGNRVDLATKGLRYLLRLDLP